MSFLISSDYLPHIQSDNLNQILENDVDILKRMEIIAQAEMESYLKTRFDVAKVFIDINPWKDLAYAIGDIVIYDDSNGNETIWQCTASTLAEQGEDPISRPSKWQAGDPRNPQVVMYMIDIVLYHLHSRINPRLIPDYRLMRYDGNTSSQQSGAIGWLKKANSGLITVDLPMIDPTQGERIRWGSDEFQNCSF